MGPIRELVKSGFQVLVGLGLGMLSMCCGSGVKFLCGIRFRGTGMSSKGIDPVGLWYMLAGHSICRLVMWGPSLSISGMVLRSTKFFLNCNILTLECGNNVCLLPSVEAIL